MKNSYQRFINFYTSYFFLFVVFLSVFLSYSFLDVPIAIYMQGIGVSKINHIADIITNFSNGTCFLIFALFLIALSIYLKKTSYFPMIFFVLTSFLISGGICDITKIIVGRARPDLLFSNHDYGFYFLKTNALFLSFPSGHATTAAATAMACSLLMPRFLPLFFIYAVIIAISRVILNAHYLSDIIAGFYLGSIVVFLWFRLINKISKLDLFLMTND